MQEDQRPKIGVGGVRRLQTLSILRGLSSVREGARERAERRELDGGSGREGILRYRVFDGHEVLCGDLREIDIDIVNILYKL